MNIDFLSFDKHHQLGVSATGCSRGFRSHATCLRNGTRLKAGMRPAGEIAHFSGFLALLFLVVEVQSTSSLRLARKPEKRTLAPVQQRNLGLRR